MSRKTTIFTVIVAVLLLFAVTAIAMNTSDKTPDQPLTDTTQTTQETNTASTPTANSSESEEIAATITYTDNGFEPGALTVKAGDAVRIENKSSGALSFNSDDHPAHTDQNELNVGFVSQSGSQTFVVNAVGTWGFHNHENAVHTGTLIVE